MPKIPRFLEGPIDNILVDFGDSIDIYFYKIGFSANDITTLSLISGLACLYLFIKGSYAYSGLAYMISYLFDCMDGHFARKYGFVSKFGDYYDHIKDIVVGTLLYIVLLQHYFTTLRNTDHSIRTVKYKYTYVILITILLILSMIHLGCQEIYYDKPTDTLQATMKLCPTKDKKNVHKFLKYTRFLSPGTVHFLVSLFIAFTPFFTELK
jgi:phosphatidylglycerophosphate synthase